MRGAYVIRLRLRWKGTDPVSARLAEVWGGRHSCDRYGATTIVTAVAEFDDLAHC